MQRCGPKHSDVHDTDPWFRQVPASIVLFARRTRPPCNPPVPTLGFQALTKAHAARPRYFSTRFDSAGRIDEAFLMLEHMARAGVAPNIASFTALIAACARLEDRDRTAHALALMQVHGLDPDELPSACWAHARLDGL